MGVKVKKFSIILAFMLLVVSLSACSGTNAASVVLENSDELISTDSLKQKTNKNEIGYQLDEPKEGEEIAVVTMSDGTIFKMRFFADEAPKTVYNFKYHAINGYYDGLTFHRVISNFMIQGGDPLGTGTGGESVWGKAFEDEFNANLLNIDGAVSMANSGANTNGSQFFINSTNNTEIDWDFYQEYSDYYKTDPSVFESKQYSTINMDKITEDYKAIYNEHGGNPSLDGYYSVIGKGHTVFAQVFEGMDSVYQMSQVETGANDKPIEDLVIKSIEIVKYQK